MYTSLSIAFISTSVILPLLALASIIGRLRARRITKARFDASDYTILATWVLVLGQLINGVIGGTIGGLGRPLNTLPSNTRTIYLKVLFVTQFLHHVSVFLVKVSVILFYKTIFTTRRFYRAANIVLAILVAWVIAFFFVTLFQDRPISRNWGRPGTTVNYPVLYICVSVTDIALDLVILCLPLPLIRRLQISAKKKWLVAGIFWLGGFCVISSVIQLYYLVILRRQYRGALNTAFSNTAVNYVLWSTIEPCSSIIAACLPLYAPFYKKWHPSRVVSIRRYMSFSAMSRDRDRHGDKHDRERALSAPWGGGGGGGDGDESVVSWKDSNESEFSTPTNNQLHAREDEDEGQGEGRRYSAFLMKDFGRVGMGTRRDDFELGPGIQRPEQSFGRAGRASYML